MFTLFINQVQLFSGTGDAYIKEATGLAKGII